MPQLVLRHGNYFAEEGRTEWRLGPSPGGHERRVHEAVAVFEDGDPDLMLTYTGALTDPSDDSEPSVALPCEVRRPPAKRSAKGGEE